MLIINILSNAERLERIKEHWKYRTSTNNHVDDVKWLIEQVGYVDSVEAENARLREALTFYADEKHYQDYDEWSPGTSDVMSDHGRKAKSALEETK